MRASIIATSERLDRKRIGFPGTLHQEEFEGFVGGCRDALEHLGARAMLRSLESDQVMTRGADLLAERIERHFCVAASATDPRGDQLQRRVLDLLGKRFGLHR